jgi:hypothetical protein
MKKSFWLSILDGNDSTSSKRLVTLIVALHFILSSFTILFLVCYIALVMPRGKIDSVLISSFEKILEYDFFIILSGLAFVTSESVVQMIIGKNKQKTQEYSGYPEYPQMHGDIPPTDPSQQPQ